MKYIIANWKMNLGVRESVALARGILRYMRGKDNLPHIVICPPFTALGEVHKATARSRTSLGAQNCGPEYRSGAYTGEISPSMLEDVHANHCIVGHSEQRHILGESNELIRKKVAAVVESKLDLILCVGETKEQNAAGDAYEVVDGQLSSALKRLNIPAKKEVFIAYEPVWAIGSGKMPDTGFVVEMHAFIRERVSKLANRAPESVHVLYGGSVTDENAYLLLRESEIDGVLVGGASLKIQSFTGIIEAARDVLFAQN